MAAAETTQKSVSIAITGAGGAGVITAGGMLLQTAARAGLYGLFGRSSGPQIRGGEAAALLRFSDGPVECADDHYDILIAVDWYNIERFAIELPLTENSLVVYDPSQGDVPEVIAKTGARSVALPMKDIGKEIGKGRPNMLALGVAAEIIGLPLTILDGILEKSLAKKGEEALTASRAAVERGAEEAKGFEFKRELPVSSNKPDGRWLISGNEAAGLGALRGGITFVAAYPITPATEVLEWLAPNLKKVGGVLVQAEDELASINMAIGGSFGGKPSLTATSGPGLALMLESIGLAVASEVPVVVVDVMRGGPSTGIPTKSEQSDLNIAVFGLHGDAPHIVTAPMSVADCVFTSQWTVHLAEATQTPAIVLSDQTLGQTRAASDAPANLAFVSKRLTAEANQEGYARYALTKSGVSPMAIPGTPGGQYTADGLEHAVSGTPSSQASDHDAQLNKRRDKITGFDYGDHWAEVDGDGELAIVTWGSTTAPAKEAIARLRQDGINVKLISLRLIAPALPENLAASLSGVSRALTIEQSHTAQFYHYIKGYFDPPCPIESFHRPGPLPIRPGELVDIIRDWSMK